MQGEELLHFIWKYRLFKEHALRTTCGKDLVIIRQGEQNFNAGPDFFNARIRIGSTLWAGNVEIHRRASEWERHGHQMDPSYNNVILHVVMDDNAPVFTSMHRRIHTLVLKIHPELDSLYRSLWDKACWLSCSSFIHNVSSVQLHLWLTKLQSERLEQKRIRITTLMHLNGPDWNKVLYLVLASGFGLPVNSLPFEMTASRIPYPLILQYRDSLEDLESLLFGQAGFLHHGRSSGPYASNLYRRYRYFRPSLHTPAVEQHLWKLLRLRPASFPSLRLSQFAALAHEHFPLLEQLLDADSLVEVEQLLKTKASEYWNTHYCFGKCSPESVKQIGQEAVRTLIINAVVPFLSAFGARMNHLGAINQTTCMLQELDAESNHIMKKWASFGIIPRNAFESQALIHLFNNYCKQHRCLDCPIGVSFVEKAFHETK